jgi:hypothetical protein
MVSPFPQLILQPLDKNQFNVSPCIPGHVYDKAPCPLGEGIFKGFKTIVVAKFGPTFSEHSIILQLLPIVKHDVNIKMILNIIRV